MPQMPRPEDAKISGTLRRFIGVYEVRGKLEGGGSGVMA